MRVKPDPTLARFEHQVHPRVALEAGWRRAKHLARRTALISFAVTIAVVIGAISLWPSLWIASFVWVGEVSLSVLFASTVDLLLLSKTRRQKWETATIEERFVWRTWDVFDEDGDVAAKRLFLLPRAPRPGERVADPYALGKLKYIAGPDVLVPELAKAWPDIDRLKYLGRTILLATTEDGRTTVMMVVPGGRVDLLKGRPEPTNPEPMLAMTPPYRDWAVAAQSSDVTRQNGWSTGSR